jgi:hypothetical protein
MNKRMDLISPTKEEKSRKEELMTTNDLSEEEE